MSPVLLVLSLVAFGLLCALPLALLVLFLIACYDDFKNRPPKWEPSRNTPRRP